MTSGYATRVYTSFINAVKEVKIICNEGFIIRSVNSYSLKGDNNESIFPAGEYKEYTLPRGKLYRITFAKSNVDDTISVEECINNTTFEYLQDKEIKELNSNIFDVKENENKVSFFQGYINQNGISGDLPTRVYTSYINAIKNIKITCSEGYIIRTINSYNLQGGDNEVVESNSTANKYILQRGKLYRVVIAKSSLTDNITPEECFANVSLEYLQDEELISLYNSIKEIKNKNNILSLFYQGYVEQEGSVYDGYATRVYTSYINAVKDVKITCNSGFINTSLN